MKRNYIGKSNTISDSNLNAYIDEVNIYRGALSSTQISNDFISNSARKELF
jgi:hypothetical protein